MSTPLLLTTGPATADVLARVTHHTSGGSSSVGWVVAVAIIVLVAVAYLVLKARKK